MKSFPKFSRFLGTVTVMAVSFGATSALADDPPGTVGRIGYMEGTVSFYGAGASDWTLATLNYPVTSGNSFWTDANGRSEIEVGSTEVRMDNMTEMSVVELDDNATRLEVPQGTINVHVGAVPIGGSVQVMTPNGSVSLTQPGSYHIDSGHPDGDQPAAQTQVTTLEGQLQINGPRSSVDVLQGENAVLSNNPPGMTLQEGNATPFDDWALMLEKREEAQAVPYVSPNMTGSEDLVRYGQWSQDPSYGAVWYPSDTVVDWAPYRYGHWAYVAPWGWTWVDYAPWGFAPFHYGRWAQIHGRWGWMPGAVVERPVYAPALVAFIGGAGWNVAFSGGRGQGIGWVPLGPHEVFHPWYHVSDNYARHVNDAYVDRNALNNITANNARSQTFDHYANQRATTVVPSDNFAHGSAVQRSMVPVTPQLLAHAPIAPDVAHITPAPIARQTGAPLTARAHEDIPHGNPAAAAGNQGITPQNVTPHQGGPFYAPRQAPQTQPSAEIAHPQEQPREMATPHPQPSEPRILEHENEPEVSRAAPTPPPHHATMPSWEASGPQHNEVEHNEGEHIAEPRPAPMQPAPSVIHPQQQTHIAPTPQGWQRQPAPAAHPAPPAAPAAPRPAGEPGGERR